MGLFGVLLAIVFMLLAVCVAFGVIAYVLFGVVFAFGLTGHFVRAVYRRESSGFWSMLTGVGWFLLIGGMDLALGSSGSLSPIGVLMILVSFGVWIYAHTLEGN